MTDICRYLLVGDSAVAVEFGTEICPEINYRIRALKNAVDKAQVEGIVETVPTYCSLLVHYDPTAIQYAQIVAQLKRLQASAADADLPQPTVIEIPVCYGGEFGPDLQNVAQLHNLRQDEVISIHSSTDYLVYMLGFIAGFPYLGGMDPRLATPRLEVPRVLTRGGSVGIAGCQTGVYPVDSPGGWQLIGRTPLKLYDPTREKVTLLDAGCYVHFHPVDPPEYRRIEDLAAQGRYVCRTWRKEV